MARPLKTLFLFEDLCYGGTQKQNLTLAKNLSRDRFTPQLVTLTGITDMDGECGDLPLLHMGKSRKIDPLFFISLHAVLRKFKPDILVPCTALPNIWGRIWGKLLRLPVIVGTCRGGGAPVRQYERFLGHLADGIVCNSRALVKVMRQKGIETSKLVYIGNGVDTEHFRPGEKRRDELVIVNVARLAKDKDHKTLIRAFCEVAGDFPSARLRLVGEGPEEASLREFCAKFCLPRLAARIEFVGASADPASEYAQADIFALSSIREGQPNVILEAMSCGLPICATDVGGIPELVTDNGLLCKAGDFRALAANLRKMLDMEQMRRQMGQNGRCRVLEEFSIDNMTRRHEDFFMQLWQNSPRAQVQMPRK